MHLKFELRPYYELISFYTECIDTKFGRGTVVRNSLGINRKCNQKCLDANKRIKKTTKAEDGDVNEDNKENCDS